MKTCYGDVPLDDGIRSQRIDGANGLSMHILEAGYRHPGRPLALLLHGFPELAFSWRKLMPLIAARGYHVIAPDQRGYGATTGWDADYDADLASFRLNRLVRDIRALLATLEYQRVAAVVGHDFGSPVAAWCALLHPDIFGCVALMSAPFAGPPRPGRDPWPQLDAALAALQPPRKHYQRYYATREANADMHISAAGLNTFLRAYFHCKSHDWPHNHPHALKSWRAEDLAALPRYYVMDLDKGMTAAAADMAPSPEEVERCTWLTDAELEVYVRELAVLAFRAPSTGIATRSMPPRWPNYGHSPGAASRCPPASSPAAATGAPIRALARSRPCAQHAPLSPAHISSRTPGTGCSRNSRSASMPHSANSSRTTRIECAACWPGNP